jgi:hypothetical protein
VDDNGGVSTAADECILLYVRVDGTAARTVAITPEKNLEALVPIFADRGPALRPRSRSSGSGAPSVTPPGCTVPRLT